MKRWKLIRTRVQKQMTVADIARLSGISTTYYRQIEAGIRTPSMQKAFAIMKVLDRHDMNIFSTDGSIV